MAGVAASGPPQKGLNCPLPCPVASSFFLGSPPPAGVHWHVAAARTMCTGLVAFAMTIKGVVLVECAAGITVPIGLDCYTTEKQNTVRATTFFSEVLRFHFLRRTDGTFSNPRSGGGQTAH